MQLSRLERILLSNQHKILEHLDAENADYHRRCQEVLSDGYEAEYRRLYENVYPDEHCLSADDCREVRDIMLMYCDLQEAHRALGGAGIEDWYVQFPGFDANNEATRLGYCQFLCKDERNTRFHRLPKGPDEYNSHMPLLDNYRRMLDAWRPITQARHGGQLTEDDLKAILSAGPDPTSEIGKALRERTRH